MDPDPLQQAWQTPENQPRMKIDMQQLLSDVRHDQKAFAVMILLRDAREIGVTLVLIPVWLVLGAKLNLPWTWYLAIPGMLWIDAFLLIHRLRQNRKRPEPGESLRRHVEDSLAQVEHQIWLLRNVFWWYLFPLGVPIFLFFAQVSWRTRDGSWGPVILFVTLSTFILAVFGYVAWLNQVAVRDGLEPRRAELERLLMGLGDEDAKTT